MFKRKTILIVLVFLLLVSSSFYFKSAEKAFAQKESTKSNIKYPKGSYSEEQEIYNEDNLKVTFKNLIYFEDKAVAYLDIENSSDKKIEFSIASISINDLDIEASAFGTILPKHSSIFIIPIYFHTLEKYGLTDIYEIKFYPRIIRDIETGDEYLTAITAKANGEEKPFDIDSLDPTTIYESQKITIKGLGFEKNEDEDEYYPLTYKLYIENKSGHNLGLYINKVMINGYNVGYAFYSNFNIDSKAISEIYIDESWNYIKDDFNSEIKTFEFDINGSDYISGEELIFVENIKLEF